MKEQPLKCNIEDDELVIRIGISTLAFCADFKFKNEVEIRNAINRKRAKHPKVSDEMQFAKDIIHELEREKEDGSTPLNTLLDDMSDEAVNNGSTGIDYPKS